MGNKVSHNSRHVIRISRKLFKEEEALKNLVNNATKTASKEVPPVKT